MNPYAELKPERSLFGKYWLAMLAVGLALLGLASAVGFIMTFGDEVVNLAMAKAGQTPVMADRLGVPLKKGWFVTGEIKESPASGSARIAIPVSGPKASGTLYVEAQKHAGFWQLELLQFAPKGSTERIDLLPAPETPQ